jgi:hypothetical protein
MTAAVIPSFGEALIASEATAEYPERMKRFGQLVGTWDVTSRFLDESSGEWVESRRTWIFSFILDGRGVQDVLIGTERREHVVAGTTVRVYDPNLGAWRVNWFGPLAGDYCVLVASGYRNGIRQDGSQTDGRPIRWNFSNITPDSFEWDGWVSNDDGATYWHQQHMDARRI